MGGGKGQNFLFFEEEKKHKESRRPCAGCLVLRYGDGALYDGEKLVHRWLVAASRPDLEDHNPYIILTEKEPKVFNHFDHLTTSLN